MKDIGEAYYVIDNKIYRDIFKGVLSLSQETYINKFLERFWMKYYSPSIALIVKGREWSWKGINKGHSICFCCR